MECEYTLTCYYNVKIITVTRVPFSVCNNLAIVQSRVGVGNFVLRYRHGHCSVSIRQWSDCQHGPENKTKCKVRLLQNRSDFTLTSFPLDLTPIRLPNRSHFSPILWPWYWTWYLLNLQRMQILTFTFTSNVYVLNVMSEMYLFCLNQYKMILLLWMAFWWMMHILKIGLNYNMDPTLVSIIEPLSPVTKRGIHPSFWCACADVVSVRHKDRIWHSDIWQGDGHLPQRIQNDLTYRSIGTASQAEVVFVVYDWFRSC